MGCKLAETAVSININHTHTDTHTLTQPEFDSTKSDSVCILQQYVVAPPPNHTVAEWVRLGGIKTRHCLLVFCNNI